MEGPRAEMAEEVDRMRRQRSIPVVMQDLRAAEMTDGPPMTADEREWLLGVREYLYDNQDADDGVPNEAMRLLVELDRLYPQVRSWK